MKTFKMKQKLSKSHKMALIAIGIMFTFGIATAQTEQSEQKSFPAQVSIFYPMGTHGQQSVDYQYNFSLNLFYGRIGGLNGVEVSGLVGRVDGDAKGIQVAGFGNASGNVLGIQVAGLGNASGNVLGIQVAGLGNASGNVLGIQVAGLGNASGNVRGIQVGGIANVAAEMEGLQIAGIYNRSQTLRGLQVGLISVNDTIESGGSLSLVNIVRRGFYRSWEVSVADYSNFAVTYRMGTRTLYTIYTVGANFIEDNLWNVGIGFGHRRAINNNLDFRPEIVSYNYFRFPRDFKGMQPTFSTHLKFGFVYQVSENFGLSLAPSVFVLNSQMKESALGRHYIVSSINPFYTYEKNNWQTAIGVGVSLGVNF